MTRETWITSLTMNELRWVIRQIVEHGAAGLPLHDRVKGEIQRRENIIAEIQ